MTQLLQTMGLCCTIAVFAALGQQGGASEDRAAQAAQRLEQLQSRLKLTPDQVERLKPIFRQQAEELKAVRDKHASDTSRRGKMQMMREMKDVQSKHEPTISAILTPEQREEWKKIKDERREEMREKRSQKP